MPRRLAKITAETCATAIALWIETRLNLRPASGRVLKIDGALWVEYRDLADVSRFGSGEIIEAVVRALLSMRVPADGASLTDDALVVELHTSDPTPAIRSVSPGITSIARSPPWQRVALFATADGVEVRDVTIVSPDWGARMVWPFSGE